MYSVKGGGITIYNDVYPTESAKAVNPKLTLKDNAAGTLEITLPPGNAGYGALERITSEITVYRDNTEIWSGRIITEQKDFRNNRILTCEGELAYLNDTTQPPTKYSDYSIRDFLAKVLDAHNQNVEDNKKFYLGAVEFEKASSYDFVTNDDVTLSVITEKLLNEFGGHLRIRKDADGIRWLDYLEDFPGTNSQEIRFGRNLIDFTRNWDMSDFITVVVPRGEKTQSSSSELDEYVDVTSVNGGSRYVTNEEGIKNFGWIEAVVDWDDISDPEELLSKAKEYLDELQFDNIVIEATAVDLRYLGVSADSIRLLDKVRCISRPHGLDRELPVSEVSIQFDKPENSTYVLSDEVRETFTSSTVDKTSSKQAIQNAVQGTLRAARDNATQLINSATRGYVTIGRNDKGAEFIAIASNNNYDPERDLWTSADDGNGSESDTQVWKWNLEGLGYSKDGGKTFDAAITMDGSIVADYITTGTLSSITIQSVADENGVVNSKWNLQDGKFEMTKGSITLGGGKFSVNDEGYLKAVYGMIGGFVIDVDSIYNSKIKLNSNGLSFATNGDDLIGSFNTAMSITSDNIKGISMALNYESDYSRFMAWAVQKRAVNASAERTTYETVLAYSTKDIGIGNSKMYGDKLTLGRPLHLNGHDIYTRYNDVEHHTFTIEGRNGNAQILYLACGDGSQIECCIVNGLIVSARA